MARRILCFDDSLFSEQGRRAFAGGMRKVLEEIAL